MHVLFLDAEHADRQLECFFICNIGLQRSWKLAKIYGLTSGSRDQYLWDNAFCTLLSSLALSTNRYHCWKYDKLYDKKTLEKRMMYMTIKNYQHNIHSIDWQMLTLGYTLRGCQPKDGVFSNEPTSGSLFLTVLQD